MKRTLGRSGVEVSAVGLGCWAIGGPAWFEDAEGNRRPMGWGRVDDDESIRAIHRALDLGVTLFDTANNYGAGRSERVLGLALAGRREAALIATKFGSVFDEESRTHYGYRPDGHPTIEEDTERFIRDSLEGSLRRLHTDYVDLYQLHVGDLALDVAVRVRDVLERLVEEGRIRFYGWSTDDPERAALFAAGEHGVAVQNALNLFQPAPEMLALAEGLGLAALNREPLRSGVLTGKFTPDTTFPEDDIRHRVDMRAPGVSARLRVTEAVRDIFTSGGRTMAQGALAWILALSPVTIPIPGFKNTRQAEDNARAMAHGPLTPEQMRQIEEIVAAEPEARS